MKKLLFILVIIQCSFIVANAQWVVINDSTSNSVVSFSDNGTYLYAALAGKGLYKTQNYGLNWTWSNTGLNVQAMNNICSKDSFIFVASNNGLFRSTNYGLTFDSLTSHPGSAFAVITLNNFLFKGMLNGIHRSTDWGNSWIIVNNEIPGNFPDIRSLTYSNNTIYAGVDYGYDLKIYKSTNYGNNWSQIGQEIPSNNIPYSLYAYDNLLLCGTETGVYKSINFGTNWSLITGIPGNIGLFGFASIGTKNIFISAWNYGVYVSNDFGQTFTLRNEGLQSLRCTALYEFGDYLFLGTNPLTIPYKIYRRPINEVVYIKNVSSETPNEYKLYQNYPNPFNSSTIVRFKIKDSKFVTLKVFNLLGKEITTLVNEKQSSGIYEISIDGSNLSTGVYFYSLFIDSKKIDTRKFILLK